jgi:hypothetical protein
MAKCPKCETGRLDPAGNCKYCVSMQGKVHAGRTDMKAPLRRLLVVTAGVMGAAYLVRGAVYLLDYNMLTDLENGDLSALDRYHTMTELTQTITLVIIGGYIFQNQVYQRWLVAANSNAMTREDVGLRWIRTVPGATEYWAWRRAWLASVWVMVILGFAIRGDATDIDRLRTSLLVQMAANIGLIVVIVFYSVSARRITGQLLAWLDTPPTPAAYAAVPAQAPAPASEAVPPAAEPDAAVRRGLTGA